MLALGLNEEVLAVGVTAVKVIADEVLTNKVVAVADEV